MVRGKCWFHLDEKPLLSEDVTVEPEGIIPQNSEYDQYTILKWIEV